MDLPAGGNIQYFIHLDTDTVQSRARSLQVATHANTVVTQHHSIFRSYDPQN